MIKSIFSAVLVMLLLGGVAIAQSLSGWSTTTSTSCRTSGLYGLAEGMDGGEIQVVAVIKIYSTSTNQVIWSQECCNKRWDIPGLVGLEDTEFSTVLPENAPPGNAKLEVRWNLDYSDESGTFWLHDDEIVKTWVNA